MEIKESSLMPVVLLCFVVFALAFLMFEVRAHEDSDDDLTEYVNVSRWVLECNDSANGCTEGGVMYHTQDGPNGNVYFIAHYPDTGNVYARTVRFN